MKHLTTLLLTLLVLGGCSSQLSRCIDSNYEWSPESNEMKFGYVWSPESNSMKYGTNPNDKLHNQWIKKQEERNKLGANKINIIKYYFLYGFEDLTDWFLWEREYFKKREKVLKDIARKKCNAQGIY